MSNADSTVGANTFFEPAIFDAAVTVEFSENVAREPLSRRLLNWLPSNVLRAVSAVAVSGVLIIPTTLVSITRPRVDVRSIVKDARWLKSPLIPDGIARAASLKSRLFVHAPHDEAELEHPDID